VWFNFFHKTWGARRRRPPTFAYLAPLLVLYFAFLVVPYALLLRMSLNRYSSMSIFIEDVTAANYKVVLTDPFYIELMLRTVALAGVVTLATLILGYPLALAIVRARGSRKSLLLGIALSPLIINLVVRTYGWMALLGDQGIINRWLLDLGLVSGPLPISANFFAVAVGLTHMTLPMMVLSLLGVMETIEPALLEAAESLGASAARIQTRIIMPLALPGVSAGSLLVFCFTTSAFVTPALLGGNRVSTVSTVIYEKFTYSLNWPVGAALVFVLLALNLALIAAHARLFRER
jgi:putative spermidine/putrescine transport system permease protein